MITTARIVAYDGENLTIQPVGYIGNELLHKQVDEVEIRLVDGRTISAQQRKKAFALIRDICEWCGHLPEEIKEYSKLSFCVEYGIDWFSLSDCDVTTARDYISFLIEFCLKHNIPCMDTLLNRTDDVSRYLYLCIKYGRCAICGKKADFHHCEGFRVGMGGDRSEEYRIGIMGMALCREHHSECHTIGELTFEDKHHVYGTKLDAHLVECLDRRKKGKEK